MAIDTEGEVRARVRDDLRPSLAHPLFERSILTDQEVAYGLAVPMPPLSAVPAGFDGIFQFSSAALGTFLGRSVRNTLGELVTVIDYDASNLSDETKRQIMAIIQAAMTPSNTLTVTVGGGQAPVDDADIDIDSFVFRVSVKVPRVTLLVNPPDQFDLRVRWTVDVHVLVPGSPTPPMETVTPEVVVTGGTGAVGVPTTAPPSGSEPGVGGEWAFVCRGSARTRGRVELDVAANRYETWARMNAAGSDIPVFAAGDVLFAAILDQQIETAVQDAAAPLFAATDLKITPRMGLGGFLRPNEQLPGLGAFHVQHVATFGNRSAHQVLSLCISLGPGAPAGDLALVAPFVGGSNFAYYAAGPIVRSVVESRFPRTDTPKVLESTVDVEMGDPDDPEVIMTGQARVRITLLGLFGVDFAVAAGGYPDSIRLGGVQELRLLQLWDPNGDPVEDLGELANPETKTFTIRVFPFGGATNLSTGPTRQFLDAIGRAILTPVFRPFVEAGIGHRLRGAVSAPLDAVFICGNLTA